MKIMQIIKFGCCLLLFALLIGCSKSSPDKKKQEELALKAKNAKEVIPEGLHPVKGVLINTIYAGTVDHPTINGGIINAANGIIVSHDEPINNSTENNNQDTGINNKMTEQNNDNSTHKPFEDKWATSQKVKLLLEQAAKTGKLDYVLKKSNAMGLPASVATVPIVESQYHDEAKSPKGAQGAWQLMPSTAKTYGLNASQSHEFVPATDAALMMLNNLHKQFGSWELAFAAYNAGPARVQSALRKNSEANSIDDLDLPKETKQYVARLMKVNHLIETVD